MDGRGIGGTKLRCTELPCWLLPGSVCGMANIAHSGSSRPAPRRLTAAESRLLRTGLLRTVFFVAAFVAFLAIGSALS